MKKIIAYAAVAITLASVCHSATLNWAVTGANADKSGTTLAGATVALVMGTSATSASGITYSFDSSSGTYSIGGGVLVDVGTLNASGKFTSPKGIAVGSEGWGTGKYSGKDFGGDATDVTSQGTGSGNATSYYMIVFDNAYNASGVDAFYTVLSAAAKTSVMSATVTAAATAFSAASGSGSTWVQYASATPVPEPCTVALLAIGIAAVALKRKVA